MADQGARMCRLENEAWTFEVRVRANRLYIAWTERSTDTRIVDDEPYVYRCRLPTARGYEVVERPEQLTCRQADEHTIEIRGRLAGLGIVHRFALHERHSLEESLQLVNETEDTIALCGLETGLQMTFTRIPGWHAKPEETVAPDLRAHRLTALPFRHAADDPQGSVRSYRFADLLSHPGAELRVSDTLSSMVFPALHRAAEGWSWEFGPFALGVFHYSDEHLTYSVLACEVRADRVALRFGGAAMLDGEPACLKRIGKGETIRLGLTRFRRVEGAYYETAYAFRAFLDERGCVVPDGFDPPVHWNELYDNPEWNMNHPARNFESKTTRSVTYTAARLEQEAAKAVACGAEALYLDPGWDTEFGSLLWGEEWLGPEQPFIARMKSEFGLQVALHCPLAAWTGQAGFASNWPREALRKDRDGAMVEGSLCLGSAAWLDAATERLLDHCALGVRFLMFDGNNWNGECRHEGHGHPVPYEKHDHVEANLELARRIKRSYPDVQIEMHDMITGGSRTRYTPVHYRYATEHSYDIRWGYELMWNPLEDLLEGRALALFYYNLACHIPLYLHIDLRLDNEHGLVFWWYASTCRHFGIGGTHRHPAVAESHKRWMKQYRRLKRFYARGEFYGSATCPEEAHFHVLKDENAAVLNLFNLTTEYREIRGEIAVADLGLDLDTWYFVPQPSVSIADGRLKWSRFLPPLGTDVLEVWPLSSLVRP